MNHWRRLLITTAVAAGALVAATPALAEGQAPNPQTALAAVHPGDRIGQAQLDQPG
jgi:hypothetical protein